jgi:hypothetical protein
MTEPGNADALTNFQPFDASPKQINPANNFVPGIIGILGWEFAIHDMQIRAADTAGRYLHANLARPGLRIGEFGPFKSSSNFL